MSPYHLQRTFKRLTGTTPKGYASARRLEQMKSRLKEGKSVSRATYDAGYSSPSRAYDHSRARLGMTPATYRRGGQGVRIAYTVVPSEAGQLLVAGTERGICAATHADLQRLYPVGAQPKLTGARAPTSALAEELNLAPAQKAAIRDIEPTKSFSVGDGTRDNNWSPISGPHRTNGLNV